MQSGPHKISLKSSHALQEFRKHISYNYKAPHSKCFYVCVVSLLYALYLITTCVSIIDSTTIIVLVLVGETFFVLLCYPVCIVLILIRFAYLIIKVKNLSDVIAMRFLLGVGGISHYIIDLDCVIKSSLFLNYKFTLRHLLFRFCVQFYNSALILNKTTYKIELINFVANNQFAVIVMCFLLGVDGISDHTYLDSVTLFFKHKLTLFYVFTMLHRKFCYFVLLLHEYLMIKILLLIVIFTKDNAGTILFWIAQCYNDG